jgi:Ser-tRNA(Ala) deacylase AlaX
MTTTSRLRSVCATALVGLWLCQGVAWGEEQWRADFDATCAKTTDAMALTLPELNQLLERCNALQKIIETQEESLRKVYLKRLQLCRNLYAYVVEFKKNEQPVK